MDAKPLPEAKEQSQGLNPAPHTLNLKPRNIPRRRRPTTITIDHRSTNSTRNLPLQTKSHRNHGSRYAEETQAPVSPLLGCRLISGVLIVRTKTVKKSSKVIIERYYPKLTLDFETNKRICDEIAIIASKRLRNKVRGVPSLTTRRESLFG